MTKIMFTCYMTQMLSSDSKENVPCSECCLQFIFAMQSLLTHLAVLGLTMVWQTKKGKLGNAKAGIAAQESFADISE